MRNHTRKPRNPLTIYLDAIERLPPPLTREEEHNLATQYVLNRLAHLHEELVVRNLRLVVQLAREYHHDDLSVGLLDLIQEGNLALLRALKTYDPGRGVRLTSYAALWIRAYILKCIMVNFRIAQVRQTHTQRKLFFNLRKERARLEALGFEATDSQLAEKMSVSERDVVEMKQLMGAQVSLSATDSLSRAGEGTREGAAQLEERMRSSDDDRPDVLVEQHQFQMILHSKLQVFGATLSGREKDLFESRLTSEEPQHLSKIGARYGVSREAIRQSERRLLRRLKKHLHGELEEYVLRASA